MRHKFGIFVLARPMNEQKRVRMRIWLGALFSRFRRHFLAVLLSGPIDLSHVMNALRNQDYYY